jgi:hypothetical protein
MAETVRVCHGRAIRLAGIYCQDCNGYHDRKAVRLPDIPQRIEECLASARSVAIMLRDDEITIHDAVKTLLIITEPYHKARPHHHD